MTGRGSSEDGIRDFWPIRVIARPLAKLSFRAEGVAV
jgi:hypothetical protein